MLSTNKILLLYNNDNLRKMAIESFLIKNLFKQKESEENSSEINIISKI